MADTSTSLLNKLIREIILKNIHNICRCIYQNENFDCEFSRFLKKDAMNEYKGNAKNLDFFTKKIRG